MSIYAWSDIHVDFPQNLEIIQSVSSTNFRKDTLIVAGDVSDRLDRLKAALSSLRSSFEQVFFVPGNHDLWTRKDDFACSIEKHLHIQEMCAALGVMTEPAKIPLENNTAVWIVPLLSWYSKPEEGADSLFVKKVGEDPSLKMWMDNYRVKWPSLSEQTPAEYFALQNEQYIVDYDAPVISFSHFLPNRNVIFPNEIPAGELGPFENDPHPAFNFTRVAGTSKLQDQIVRLGSKIHFYGHQHRNKIKPVGSVTYISHCMGYPGEDRYAETGDKLAPVKLPLIEN